MTMKIDLDTIEATARKAQEKNPGPWRKYNYGKPAESTFPYIVDSSPRPDWTDDPDEVWPGERIITTDSNYYGPHGPTADHIAQCSPDVVLALVARVRELENPSHFDKDGNEFEGDALESEEFYELMQAYRHRAVLNQVGTIEAFEAVKSFIRERFK